MLNNLSQEEREHLITLFTHRGPLGADILVKNLTNYYQELNDLALSGKIEGHELSHKLGQALAIKQFVQFLEDL